MVRSNPDGGLQKLADETGGGYFELQKAADLSPTFTRVAQELHSQYVIGFAPTQLDNKVHKLAVKVKQSGLTARARRSYLTAPDKYQVQRPPPLPIRNSGSRATKRSNRLAARCCRWPIRKASRSSC